MLTWHVLDEPPAAADALVVDAGLDAANLGAAPQLAEVRPLAALARADDDGRVVGGAIGRTWGECCELQQLWVDPARRHGGIGAELLGRFEARAVERGCRVAYLTTFSFQAPDFYRRFGYASAAEIGGFPGRIVNHLMLKTLRPGV